MDFKSNPDLLFDLGFDRFDDSSDSTRVVKFRKILYTIENLAFTLEIKYDLTIYDDSDADYGNNLDWSYDNTLVEIKELADELINRDYRSFVRCIEIYPTSLGDIIKYMELGKMIEKLANEIS
jgi:hypothetical protein